MKNINKILILTLLFIGISNILSASCTKNTGKYEINNGQDVNWADIFNVSLTDIDKDITIYSGGKLTIQNAIIYIRPNVKITVEAGGELIIENCTLMVDQSCGTNYWRGIDVEGNSSYSQVDVSGDREASNQGYLEISSSTIRHMYSTISPGGITLFDGGIINANDVDFENNYISIYFDEYTPVKPFGWKQKQEIFNHSKIRDCTFDWDNFLTFGTNIYDNYTNYIHIVLDAVQNVQIEGNTFKNSSTTHYELDERGIGINIYQSSVIVHPTDMEEGNYDDDGCPIYGQDSIRNRFFHLSKGIKFYDSESGTNKLAVSRSQFKHCEIGIYIENGIDHLIHDNLFHYGINQDRIDYVRYGELPYFVKMTGSDGSVIYENQCFNNHVDMRYFYTSACASQYSMKFKNNSLHFGGTGTNNTRGNYIEGNNNKMFLLCNEYYDLDIDWYIEEGATLQNQYKVKNNDPYFYPYRNRFSRQGDPLNQVYNISNNINHGGSNILAIAYYTSGTNEKPACENTNIVSPTGPLASPYSNNAACADLPCDISIFPVSIETSESNSNIEYHVYPNPTTDELHVFCKKYSSPESKLLLIDSQGKIVLEQDISNIFDFTIDMSTFEKGIYFIKIFDDEYNSWIGRVVKL
jgi:hypothetical protein